MMMTMMMMMIKIKMIMNMMIMMVMRVKITFIDIDDIADDIYDAVTHNVDFDNDSMMFTMMMFQMTKLRGL